MKEKKYNLAVVAHPDDETLFMGGWILSQRKLPWHVICVTDANADGAGKKRRRQFQRACEALSVKSHEHWDFPDVYKNRLDVSRLESLLLDLPLPANVYTHGVVGEYGHPHHQDVSYAVHKTFHRRTQVWSVAQHCLPNEVVQLKPSVFAKKSEILQKIYGSETQRFSHILPNSFAEGFTKVSLKEVEAIYRFLETGKKRSVSDIKVYKHYWPYFSKWYSQVPARLF